MDDPRGPGRPPYEPTDKDRMAVETMGGYGIPQVAIAQTLGIDAKTLRKYFPDQVERGALKATMMVAENLHRIARGDGREAVTACIFWLKVRAGWSERAQGDVPGAVVINVINRGGD